MTLQSFQKERHPQGFQRRYSLVSAKKNTWQSKIFHHQRNCLMLGLRGVFRVGLLKIIYSAGLLHGKAWQQ